jgi:hypothetical protein
MLLSELKVSVPLAYDSGLSGRNQRPTASGDTTRCSSAQIEDQSSGSWGVEAKLFTSYSERRDEGPAPIFNRFSVEKTRQPFCFQPLGENSKKAIPAFATNARLSSSDLFPSWFSIARIGRCRTNSRTFLCRGDGNLKQPFGREQEKWLRLGEILFCKSIDVFLRVVIRLRKRFLARKIERGMSRGGHANVFFAPQKKEPFRHAILACIAPVATHP